MIDVVLLGTGNVASHLFRAFSASENIRVKQVYNHSAGSLSPFGSKAKVTTSLEELASADIYLLALKDDVIPDLAARLGHLKGLVLHTSGAVALGAMKGPDRTGVFYPLQTFSRELPVNYKEIPFCVEVRHERDLELLKGLASGISGKIYEISSAQRKKLHLAAVFVCNFVNHLYSIGEDICQENSIPFEILQPLIRKTAEKIQASSPGKVQTGPAIRHDQSTIDAHMDLITSRKNQEIYQLLTQAIQSFHGQKL